MLKSVEKNKLWSNNFTKPINSYLHLQEKNSKPISFNKIQTKYYKKKKKKKNYNVEISGEEQALIQQFYKTH